MTQRSDVVLRLVHDSLRRLLADMEAGRGWAAAPTLRAAQKDISRILASIGPYLASLEVEPPVDLQAQIPRARSSDPATSHEAAASVRSFQTELHQRILRILEMHEEGLSDQEIRSHLRDFNYGDSTVRSRRAELVKMGLVKAVPGKTRTTRSGRKTQVWALTENVGQDV